MENECVNHCPNGCGELDTCNGHIDDNEGDTYFEVTIEYCPECKYINHVDARL